MSVNLNLDTNSKTISLHTVKYCAIHLLARREHSQYELRQKLKKRNFPQDLIEKAIEQLSSESYLSDERFAEAYVRMRSRKGYGINRIHAELKERGIDEALSAKILKAEYEQEVRHIQHAFHKKFGDKLAVNFTERAKQMRFLQYRGFSLEQIKKFFKQSLGVG